MIKRILAFILIALLCSSALMAFAETVTAEAPKLDFIMDPAGILREGDRQSLDKMLADVYDRYDYAICLRMISNDEQWPDDKEIAPEFEGIGYTTEFSIGATNGMLRDFKARFGDHSGFIIGYVISQSTLSGSWRFLSIGDRLAIGKSEMLSIRNALKNGYPGMFNSSAWSVYPISDYSNSSLQRAGLSGIQVAGWFSHISAGLGQLRSLLKFSDVNKASSGEEGTKTAPRFYDGAGLLTEDEVAKRNAELEKLSNKLGFDIAIVTTDDLEDIYHVAFADDYFDYNDFGLGSENDRDGVLMLISVDPSDRCVYISTSGFGLLAMTDAGIDYMLDIIVDKNLANNKGDYKAAVDDFISLCNKFVRRARFARPYDVGHMPLTVGTVLIWLICGAFVGVIAAMITISLMSRKHISIKAQETADWYIEKSLHLNTSTDTFVSKSVTRTVRSSDSSGSGGGGHGGGSSSHSSSSGSSHGGGGRSF